MKKNNYTPEELEIVNYIESGKAKSVDNLEEEKALLKQIVKDNTQKKKQVNFRLLESDLEKLKTKALIEGIPYQTLLSSIIHKFLNGNLTPKNS
jgi:predicted DNA binding CopG/RHH family protein